MFDEGDSSGPLESAAFDDPDPAHRTEVRTVRVTDDDDEGTVTRIETTTIVTRDGDTVETKTETREEDDPDKEKLIKEMFAGEKGVMDFFNDDEQKPQTDETEI